jgi:hypothetical protein
MKKNLLIMSLLFFCCKKYPVPAGQVISNLTNSSKTLLADGISIDTLTVRLNNAADSDHRSVLFTASVAGFVGGSSGSDTVAAIYYDKVLTATAYFQAPLKPGTSYVTVSPANPDFNTIGNYILMDTVIISPSVASSVTLQTSNFGIASNYQSTITLKGILQNAAGNPVSLGTGVAFSSDIPGQFGLLNVISDSSSSVNANFQVGNVTKGTIITITVTVLDAAGNLTPVKNNVQITVTQ